MHFNAISLLTVALATYAAAAPTSLAKRARMVIGYRTMNNAEAAATNDKGTLVPTRYTGFFIIAQLGKGKYLTPGPGDWQGESGSNYCVIWADSDKFHAAKKLWVPIGSGQVTSDKSITDFVDSKTGGNPPADHVLRFAPISKNPGLYQMLIPHAMLREGGDDSLGLEAQCFSSLDALKAVESGVVDYWSLGIQDAPPSGSGPAHPNQPPPPPGPPGPN